MKYVDEYRDPIRLQQALADLRRRCSRRWVIMDVCGGQTHGLLRHGIEDAVSDVLELIHGPGCPVCVTPAEVIDDALHIARNPRVILATFGDMLRVPGPNGSLLQQRARGADVRTMLSPVDAVSWAIQHPDREVVLFAVGFETTAPATALAVLQARELGIKNFSILAHHVRVEPAMWAIATSPECRVQGFLAAGHVCTVTGYAGYERLAQACHLPIVITGFEPLDLLEGLRTCVDLLERNEAAVVNPYARCARSDGNPAARTLIDQVFAIGTVPWRGMGRIVDGGLQLKAEFREFDARQRFEFSLAACHSADDACLSGDVLSGRLKPPECPLFGNACTPTTPLGAPMVSSEGACAAYFHYGRLRGANHA